jgi:hypothetical protein
LAALDALILAWIALSKNPPAFKLFLMIMKSSLVSVLFTQPHCLLFICPVTKFVVGHSEGAGRVILDEVICRFPIGHSQLEVVD